MPLDLETPLPFHMSNTGGFEWTGTMTIGQTSGIAPPPPPTCNTPVVDGLADVVVDDGATATLGPITVTGGTPPFFYQWYRGLFSAPADRVLIPGATSSSYQFVASVPTHLPVETYYHCMVWNNCVELPNGVPVELLVTQRSIDPPTFTTHPSSDEVLPGATVSLSVTVVGPPHATITFQWYKNGAVIPGATSNVYQEAVSVNTTFYCRATNTYGTTQSNTASITVFVPPTVPEGVLTAPTYLGAFRISDTGLERTVFSYGGCAGRKVGGVVKLLFTAGVASLPESMIEQIIEVTDPGTYSTNYTTAPIATTVFYGNEYRDKRFTWRAQGGGPDFFPGTPAVNYGLYWHEGNQLLYIAYQDTYDVTASQTHGMLAVQLNGDLTTVGYGPWSIRCVDGKGRIHRGPGGRAHYFTRNPNTGVMVCGGTLSSGNARHSWGPSLYQGAAFPTASTPVGENEIINQPQRGLDYYFMGFDQEGFKLTTSGLLLAPNELKSYRHRLRPGPFEYYGGNGTPECLPDDVLNVDPALYTDAIGPTGSWRDLDFVHGMIWVNYGSKAGVLYAASLCDGHEWYQNVCKPTCPSHGQDVSGDSNGITGPVSTSIFPSLICYDPAEIQRVLTGQIQDWQAEPAWHIDVEALGVHTADESVSGAQRHMAMGYFDTDTGKLYCVANRADDTRPFFGEGTLCHVFQFSA